MIDRRQCKCLVSKGGVPSKMLSAKYYLASPSFKLVDLSPVFVIFIAGLDQEEKLQTEECETSSRYSAL